MFFFAIMQPIFRLCTCLGFRHCCWKQCMILHQGSWGWNISHTPPEYRDTMPTPMGVSSVLNPHIRADMNHTFILLPGYRPAIPSQSRWMVDEDVQCIYSPDICWISSVQCQWIVDEIEQHTHGSTCQFMYWSYIQDTSSVLLELDTFADIRHTILPI